MGILSSCRRLSFYSVSAALVLVVSFLAGTLSDTDTCASQDDCTCPSGWYKFCVRSTCYGSRPDKRCLNLENGHKFDGGSTWCWDQKIMTLCTVRPKPLAAVGGFFKQLLALVDERLAKAIPLLVRMWYQPKDKQAQIRGCNMLADFGWNDPESKTPLMRVGAIDRAIAAVKHFHGDTEVEHQCLNSVAALNLYNRETSLYAADLGVIELTVDFWKRNFDDPKHNIANYFGCYQDYAPENRERMREAGAIKMIFDACGEGGKHFWDAGSQFSCWCAFSSFHTDLNYKEFVRLDGLRHLHATFRDHPKSYRVREEILQAAKGICAYKAYRAVLAEMGFVELLTDAVQTEGDDPQVQALGLETLRMFIDANASLRSMVVAKGGVNTTFQTLEKHAAKLLNTRAAWDSQNVYGTLNDDQYCVPGAAAEIVYSLALDSLETQRAMLELGAVKRLDTAIVDTMHRIPNVKWRTFTASCQTLRLLRAEAAAAGQLDELQRVLAVRQCPNHDEHPRVVAHSDIVVEP